MNIIYYTIFNYSFCVGLGMLFAYSELLSRYRDTWWILRSGNAWIYMLINGVAAYLAYYFIRINHWQLGGLATTPIGKVLVAGLSAMFVLRSSFFSFKDRETDKTVNVGIASIINVFLNNAERKYDQSQSIRVVQEIKRIMTRVDFDKAAGDLPTLCLSLMENVSSEEQKKLLDGIEKLKAGALNYDLSKSISLGILIARITGLHLLEEGVRTLSKYITEGEMPPNAFNYLDAELDKLKQEEVSIIKK